MKNELPQQTEKPDNNPNGTRPVDVTLDGTDVQILFGHYSYASLKTALQVPDGYCLVQVVGGNLKELKDANQIHIEGHEVFITHVRRGGAS